MTERQSDDVVEILRSRLGVRYQSGVDEGRAAMVRTLRDELGLDADQAEAAVRDLIDGGHLRYVTADERDPETRDDGRSRRQDDHPRYSTDPADLNVVPATGGPQAGTSGLATGSAAVAAGAGSGSPAAGPLAVAAAAGGVSGGEDRGYWDIGAGATGVVPSSTRKGQVEPKGT